MQPCRIFLDRWLQQCLSKVTRLRHSKASWWSAFKNRRDWQKTATMWSRRSRSNPLRTTPVPFPATLWHTNTVRLGYHSDTISSNQEFRRSLEFNRELEFLFFFTVRTTPVLFFFREDFEPPSTHRVFSLAICILLAWRFYF